MSKKRCVPVRDHAGKAIIFRRTPEEAQRLIECGTCFVLIERPLELALSHAPGRRSQIEIERLRPDRSLTIPPSLIRDAADGIEGARAIVLSYEENHTAQVSGN